MTLEARRIHLVGAGGAGMSAIAKVLAGMGRTVSGSDLRGGSTLDRLVEATLFDDGRLTAMREAASVIARPNAASAIAKALIEASK
ncbi:MAG: Mur ligase domain-containing protein [Acidimicrobiia bacterium]